MSQQPVRTERPGQTASQSPELSLVVTSLVKGVVYREAGTRTWRDLLALEAQARDFVATLGLEVVIDESEGYAYLRAQPEDEGDGTFIPRLVARRELSFDVSLLLALLRKRLAQFDSEGGDTRLVLTRDEIVDLVRVFLPGSSNEARARDRVEANVRRVVDLGFLRPVPDTPDTYEVRRILKAFVDGQWLADFDARLGEYAAELASRDGGALLPDGGAPAGVPAAAGAGTGAAPTMRSSSDEHAVGVENRPESDDNRMLGTEHPTHEEA
ncbi:DUF4194 domain-containing protein [Oerskovia enterophila]|uniref:DUF4194 domain-containing protein n=1 Tax=Oerskovia enterophila TaxID=43678 RepID=UPI0033937ED1